MSVMCQCCGKEIKFGEPAIQVAYGSFELMAKAPVNGKYIAYSRNTDYFHQECDVAIREKRR